MPASDADGAGERAGAAERQVSRARLAETLGAGNHRADDVGGALDGDDGVPLLTASVSSPPVPVLSVQLCFVAGFKSSKTRVPTVRAPSSVTVGLTLRLRVLKSAAASVPPAMSPPLQLLPVDQEPPPMLVQTLEPAGVANDQDGGSAGDAVGDHRIAADIVRGDARDGIAGVGGVGDIGPVKLPLVSRGNRADHRGRERRRQPADQPRWLGVDGYAGRAEDIGAHQAEAVEAGHVDVGIHGLDGMDEDAGVDGRAEVRQSVVAIHTVQFTPSIETELMNWLPTRWSLYHRLPPPRLPDHALASPLPPRIVSSSK